MRRLEKKKLILSYHANINLRALTSFENFFTEITLRTHRLHDVNAFENKIKKIDEVVECFALSGGINYLLKFVCPDVAYYQTIMDELLETSASIERYVTYIVTKQVKSVPQLRVDTVVRFSSDHNGLAYNRAVV
jgi:Lrp/AsnC family transcriptional regulator of ectoine degradation